MNRIAHRCSSKADHFLRSPLCNELPCWKRVALFAASFLLGILTLGMVHFVYNFGLRRKVHEYKNKTPHKKLPTLSTPIILDPKPEKKPPSTYSSSHSEETTSEKCGEELTAENPQAKLLALYREQSSQTLNFYRSGFSFSSSDFDLNLCKSFRAIDLRGCKLADPSALIEKLEALDLNELKLDLEYKVKVSSFLKMSEKNQHLLRLQIGFESEVFFTKRNFPFTHCLQLVELVYWKQNFAVEEILALLSSSKRLKEITIWVSTLPFSLGSFQTKMESDLERSTIISAFEHLNVILEKKDFRDFTFFSFKHSKMPSAFTFLNVDSSRILTKTALSYSECQIEWQERKFFPPWITKNFNLNAFKAWIRRLKSDPEKLKAYFISFLFHLGVEDKNARELNSLLFWFGDSFIEELEISEIQGLKGIFRGIDFPNEMRQALLYFSKILDFAQRSVKEARRPSVEEFALSVQIEPPNVKK